MTKSRSPGHRGSTVLSQKVITYHFVAIKRHFMNHVRIHLILCWLLKDVQYFTLTLNVNNANKKPDLFSFSYFVDCILSVVQLK